MLRGLCNLSFFADDVAAARAWYADLVGREAYFERSGSDGRLAYVEFRLGDDDDELGIVDRRYAAQQTGGDPAGATAYWHVDDLAAARERLLAAGARPLEPVSERGAGFVTASVVDPFGNILGLMHSPHYLQVQGGQ